MRKKSPALFALDENWLDWDEGKVANIQFKINYFLCSKSQAGDHLSQSQTSHTLSSNFLSP